MIISNQEIEQEYRHCLTFCPDCNEEDFMVTVKDSGTSFDGERVVHWFEGDGNCLNCGLRTWLSDSD